MNDSNTILSAPSFDSFPAEALNIAEILDAVSDFIVSLAPDGKILYANRACRTWLGCDEDEIKNLNFFDVIHPASRERCREMFGRILDGENTGKIEIDFITKAGARISVDGGISCLTVNGEVIGARGIFRNLSEYREAERALRDSEEQFEAFMNNSPAAVVIKDDTGRYVYANKTMRKILPLGDYENVSMTARDLVGGETAAKADEAFQKVLETGEVVETIETAPTPEGISRQWVVIRFPFTKSGGRKFVGGLALDITERIEVEEKLRRSEWHYRNLVEGGQGYICTHDRDGTMLSVNPAAAHSLDYEVGEIVGKNMREFMKPSLHRGFGERLEAVWQNSSDSGLMYLLTRSGEERVWKYQNVKLTETVAEPVILGYAQDITEMLETERELKNLSLTDDLTGLYNRRGFLTFAERQLRAARAAGKRQGVFVIFADMDGLKQINDTYGHDAGSRAIVKISELLAGSFRGSDVIARLGGDEFVILVIDERDETQEIVVNRINAKIDDYNRQKLHPVDLSLSIGITPVEVQKFVSIEELLRRADAAMYEQKRMKKLS